MTAFEEELIEYLAYETEQGEDEVLIEVLCRKLHKHRLIDKTDDLWILEVEGGDAEMSPKPSTTPDLNYMQPCPDGAVDGLNLDEWCTDCREYDHERHCCPRFNRVIRSALAEMEISDD